MDKSQISKKKYVYHVYLARSNPNSYEEVLHIEKHPLIYANSEYLYYKGSRYSRLTCVEMYRARDCFNADEVQKLIVNKTLNLYYWNVEDKAAQMFEELRTIYQKLAEQRAIDKIHSDLRAAKCAYDRAKKKYDALPDEVKRGDIDGSAVCG